MIPYIYTLAARTTFEGYTPMRALAFDFRSDRNSLDVSDEFMLGPSLLVAPVTDAWANQRSVYLPAGSDWYDFWTGQRITGGKRIVRQTPLSVMPLYVRAGTILPLGPESEFTGQHPEAPIELRIYAGRDGDFKLYEDDGATYDYEKGAFSWIPIHWDNASNTLTIGERQGSFPGEEVERVFRVVIVGPRRGAGEAVGGGRSIHYNGTEVQLQIPLHPAVRGKK
jgi:alpha-D-xyloside xylohydrolase